MDRNPHLFDGQRFRPHSTTITIKTEKGMNVFLKEVTLNRLYIHFQILKALSATHYDQLSGDEDDLSPPVTASECHLLWVKQLVQFLKGGTVRLFHFEDAIFHVE